MKSSRDSSIQAESADQRGGALGDFAEELGSFLGNTERKASEWLNQRKAVTAQLTAIRDKASSLLSQMGQVVPDVPFRRRRRQRGSTESTAAPTRNRLKGSTISEETRRKMVEAARRRWANKGKRRDDADYE